MRKVLAIGLLSISLAQAKFFIGVEGAFDMYALSDIGKKNGSYFVSYGSTVFKYGVLAHGWHTGVNLGTQHMFGDYVGLRWLLGIGYGQILVNGGEDLDRITPYLGLDILVNFIDTGNAKIGIYAGASAGLDNLRWVDAQGDVVGHIQMSILGRVGLATEFTEHHRIELGATIPIATIHTNVAHSPITTSLGYKFVF